MQHNDKNSMVFNNWYSTNNCVGNYGYEDEGSKGRVPNL